MWHTILAQDRHIEREEYLRIRNTGANLKFLVFHRSGHCRITAIIKQGVVPQLKLERGGSFKYIPVGESISNIESIAAAVEQKLTFHAVGHLFQRYHIKPRVQAMGAIRQV